MTWYGTQNDAAKKLDQTKKLDQILEQTPNL